MRQERCNGQQTVDDPETGEQVPCPGCPDCWDRDDHRAER